MRFSLISGSRTRLTFPKRRRLEAATKKGDQGERSKRQVRPGPPHSDGRTRRARRRRRDRRHRRPSCHTARQATPPPPHAPPHHAGEREGRDATHWREANASQSTRTRWREGWDPTRWREVASAFSATEVQIVDREILAGDRYGHAHPSEFTQTQLQAVQQTLSNTKRARRPQRRAHQNRTPLGG